MIQTITMAATKLLVLMLLNLLFGIRMVLGRALWRSLDDVLNSEGTSTPGYKHTFHPRDKASPIEVNTSYKSPPEDFSIPFKIPRHLHRRALVQPAPATDSEFDASAAKGCSMLYMLAANVEDALTRMKTNPKLSKLSTSQSQWDKDEDLKQFGWAKNEVPVDWAYLGVDDVMRDLSIDTASNAGVNVRLVQDIAVEVEGMKFVVSVPASPSCLSLIVSLHDADYASIMASNGTYEQAIDVAAGLVIPHYVFSPYYEVQANNIEGKVVPFAQYSDVLFLEYFKLCSRAKASVSGLKYLLFLNVGNTNTWAVVLKALMNRNDGKKDISQWPGTEFSMNEAEGKALLGTQVGAPLAWMLIQHKKAFGAKSVVKVSLRSSNFQLHLVNTLIN